MSQIRLAADIGGTFTDVALESGGALHTAKVLTTPTEPAAAVMEGIARVIQDANVRPQDIDVFIHGTTLATNALIERRGAKTALLTTAGMRDSIEIAHENRFEQYDLAMVRPEPLVPRNLRIGIPERLSALGEALLPLDTESLLHEIKLLKEAEVESLAIGFLHSYLDPTHEIQAAELTQQVWPEVSITLLF